MTRKSKHRKWYFLLSTAAVLAILIVFASIYTEQRREAAMARFQPPPETQAYLELMEAASADTESASAPEEVKAARSSMEEFARLSEYWRTQLAGDEEWRKITDADYPRGHRERTDADWRLLEETTTRDAALFADLRELAAMGGPFQTLDLSQGLKIVFPHHSILNDFARKLGYDALAAARAGDWERAVANFIAQTQFSSAIEDEPLVMPQLVSMALRNTALDTVESITAHHEHLPREYAPVVFEALASHDHRASMGTSIISEARAFAGPIFEQLRNHQVDETISAGMGRIFSIAYRTPIAPLLADMDQITYMETAGAVAELASQPYYEIQDELTSFQQAVQSIPFYKPISNLSLAPATYGDIYRSTALVEARVNLLRTGMTLEYYHADHGTYPESLNAIAGELGGVPIDSLTGEPLHYSASNGSFTLYSVGMDLEDDGGIHNYQEGDIVWRGERTEMKRGAPAKITKAAA